MKIKKYIANTEKDAMLKVKEELGKEALIVSVKNIKPKGFYKMFKKPYVEVTAAVDKNSTIKNISEKSEKKSQVNLKNSTIAPRSKETMEEKSKPIYNENNQKRSTDNLSKLNNLSKTNNLPKLNNLSKPDKIIAKNDESILKVIYEQLLENEVQEEYANQLTLGLNELTFKGNNNIDEIVSIVYKRIVKLLSDYEPIKTNKTKNIVFVGPTGVGKTTTIAKIASYFLLNKGKKIGLITADTYRIAASEQLRTYANILNIPIKVVYGPNELENAIKEFKEMDLILIDTAGRSHKNEEHLQELKLLLDQITDKEVLLVLSATSKFNDMVKITDVYDQLCKYKLIITKLDETTNYGNILNIKLKTDAKLSYITFGQNVPEDFSEVNIYEIAKKILGGSEGGPSYST